MSTVNCSKSEKIHPREKYKKSGRRPNESSLKSEVMSSLSCSQTTVSSGSVQMVPHFQFARAIQTDPVNLPEHLSDVHGRFERASVREHRGGGLDTGKVKVIVCVRQSECTPQCGSTSEALTAGERISNPGTCFNPSSSLSLGGFKGCVTIDRRKNQLALLNPTPPIRKRVGASNPKHFTFDAVLGIQDQPLNELCSLTLVDVIKNVIRGQDGCVLTVGHRHTGKTRSMVGSDVSSAIGFGIIPCAISWLFQVLNRQKERTGIRFSVRVSAVAISGLNEKFHDLLEDAATTYEDETSPSHYLRTPTEPFASNDPQADVNHSSECESVAGHMGKCLSQQREIRVASAEKAAHLLDIALTKRAAVCTNENTSSHTNASGLFHMLFTFHVYQCRVEQNETGAQVFGGRSRLHLLDLGCGRYGNPAPPTIHNMGHQKCKMTAADINQKPDLLSIQEAIKPEATDLQTPVSNVSKCLSISGMTNVLLALLTGQRHLPFRDSALTHLIKEAITGTQMHPCVLAHLDSGAQYYTETLQVLQLASKLGRLRRRRVGPSTSIPAHLFLSATVDDTESSMDSFSDSGTTRSHRRRRGPRMGKSSYASSYTSDMDFSSSSEQSCETVIYMGHRGFKNALYVDEFNNSILSKLGPRGKADGSVDARSVSSGQLSGGEQQTRTLTRNCETMGHKKNEIPSGSTIHSAGSVKRMIPRTNATVWPRALSPNLKEAILSQEETWIDGPKARDTHKGNLNSAGEHRHFSSQSDHLDPKNNVSSLRQQPAYSCGSMDAKASQVSPNARSDGSCKQITCSQQQMEQFHCKPTPHSLNEDDFTDEDQCQFSSTNTSNCSTLEHAAKPRALSDISERTEETETVQEGNTIKSSSTGPRFDSLALLRIDGLPHADEFILGNRIVSNGTVEKVHPSSFEKAQNVSRLPETYRIDHLDANGRPMDSQNLEMCLSHIDRTASVNFNEIFSPRTPESLHRLGYSPLKSLNPTFTEHVQRPSNDTKAYTNGCGENLLNLDETSANSTTFLGDKLCAYIQHETSMKLQTTNSNVRSKDLAELRCSINGRLDLPEASRKRLGQQHTVAYTASESTSLSRVAAWVDSIVNPNNCQMSVRCQVPQSSTMPVNQLVEQPFNNCSEFHPKSKDNCLSNPLWRCPPSDKLEIMQQVQPHRPYGCSYAQNSNVPRNSEGTHVTGRVENQSSQHQDNLAILSGSVLSCHPASKFCATNFSPGHTLTATSFDDSIQLYCPQASVMSQNNHNSSNQIHASQRQICAMKQHENVPSGFSSLPRYRQSTNSTEYSRKSSTYVPTRQVPVCPYPGKPSEIPLNNLGDTTNQCTTEMKPKASKSQKGFRFPTLPIFRSFRLRRDRKKVDTKAAHTQSGKPENFTTQYSSTFEKGSGFQSLLSPRPIAIHTEHCHICSPLPNSLCSDGFSTPTLHHRADFAQMTAPATSSPVQLQPIACTFQPKMVCEAHSKNIIQQSTTGVPKADIRRISSTNLKQYPDAETRRCQLPHDTCVPLSSVPQLTDTDQSQFALPISPSGPPGSPHYFGPYFTPICRSGRRSVNGGAASSGYESMRIGTSDLSLSHPDSASDCSGIVLPNGSGREATKSRLLGESHRRRCHSSTTGSRTSGSAGSGVSYLSPIHLEKKVERVSQNSEQMAYRPSTNTVSSFLK